MDKTTLCDVRGVIKTAGCKTPNVILDFFLPTIKPTHMQLLTPPQHY